MLVVPLRFNLRVNQPIRREARTVTLVLTREFVNFCQVILQLQMELALVPSPSAVFAHAAPLLARDTVLLEQRIRALVVQSFHFRSVGRHGEMIIQWIVMG